jgi:hypothetical protein
MLWLQAHYNVCNACTSSPDVALVVAAVVVATPLAVGDSCSTARARLAAVTDASAATVAAVTAATVLGLCCFVVVVLSLVATAAAAGGVSKMYSSGGLLPTSHLHETQ